MVGPFMAVLLTAWARRGSGACIVLYAWLSIDLGLAAWAGFNQTMMILGVIDDWLDVYLLIRPVADKWFMTADELGKKSAIPAK